MCFRKIKTYRSRHDSAESLRHNAVFNAEMYCCAKWWEYYSTSPLPVNRGDAERRSIHSSSRISRVAFLLMYRIQIIVIVMWNLAYIPFPLYTRSVSAWNAGDTSPRCRTCDSRTLFRKLQLDKLRCKCCNFYGSCYDNWRIFWRKNVCPAWKTFSETESKSTDYGSRRISHVRKTKTKFPESTVKTTINNPDARGGVYCSHKEVAAVFSTLCYDVKRRGCVRMEKMNRMRLEFAKKPFENCSFRTASFR